MNKRWITAMMMMMIVDAYQNLLLIGSRHETMPLARHYAKFYNATLLDTMSYVRPMRYVIILEEPSMIDMEEEDTFLIVSAREYLSKTKNWMNLNYFISWLKQTYT